jgi:hypothetical protein
VRSPAPAADLEIAVVACPPEPLEARIVRYLNWAGEAAKSAAQARSRELRDAHLAIATSWMRLAEEAMRRFDSRRAGQI